MAGYEEYTMIPKPDNEKKEEARKLFLASFEKKRMTDIEFIWGQVRFISTRMWIGQLAALALLCICAKRYIQSPDANYCVESFISTMTPVFVIFQVDEIGNIFRRKMLELEATMRFSVKKQLLSRMIILGITDLILMAVWIVALHLMSEKAYVNLLMYTLVPFNITVTGLFFLLNFTGEGYAYRYMALSYMALVCGVFTVLPRWKNVIYAPDYQFLWVILFVVSTGLCICMMGSLWHLYSDNNRLRERKYYGTEY